MEFCSKCGRKLVAGTSYERGKKPIEYLHCTNPKCGLQRRMIYIASKSVCLPGSNSNSMATV